MGDYASAANAAALSGVAVGDINTTQVSSINSFIDQMLNRTFDAAVAHVHYMDIPKGGLKIVQLQHYPIVTLSEFQDNQRGTSPTNLVEDTDYTLDKNAGLIALIDDDFNILKGSSTLTVGRKTVKLTYTWGYATIPADISLFADWMLAWIAEIKKATGATRTTDGAVLRRIQIGDYAEAYDTNTKAIDDKYKRMLSDMTSMLIGKYKFIGDIDGDYNITV